MDGDDRGDETDGPPVTPWVVRSSLRSAGVAFRPSDETPVRSPTETVRLRKSSHAAGRLNSTAAQAMLITSSPARDLHHVLGAGRFEVAPNDRICAASCGERSAPRSCDREVNPPLATEEDPLLCAGPYLGLSFRGLPRMGNPIAPLLLAHHNDDPRRARRAHPPRSD